MRTWSLPGSSRWHLLDAHHRVPLEQDCEVRQAASQDFYTAVVDFRRRWGHAPHPGAVVQSFCNIVGNLPTAPYATFLAEVVE